MGLLDARRDARERVEGKAERSSAVIAGEFLVPRWEYLALNLKTTPGATLEAKLDTLGNEGWEAVCSADGHLVLKRLLGSWMADGHLVLKRPLP
jgi:hypothetical protein